LIYGPWSFIANGIFQAPKVAVIQASKLLGFIHLVGCLVIFWMFFQKKEYLGLLALIFLGFDNFSYVNRPDSFLIFYPLVGLFLLERYGDKVWAWISVGILSGLATACKAHGFIYFLPLLIFGVEKRRANPALIL